MPLDTMVQTTTSMLSSDDALYEVQSSYGKTEITDECARTVASWFASPGSVGHVLAELSQGTPVDLESLLTDVRQTRLHTSGLQAHDQVALDMLATWAIRQVNDRA